MELLCKKWERVHNTLHKSQLKPPYFNPPSACLDWRPLCVNPHLSGRVCGWHNVSRFTWEAHNWLQTKHEDHDTIGIDKNDDNFSCHNTKPCLWWTSFNFLHLFISAFISVNRETMKQSHVEVLLDTLWKQGMMKQVIRQFHEAWTWWPPSFSMEIVDGTWPAGSITDAQKRWWTSFVISNQCFFSQSNVGFCQWTCWQCAIHTVS